MKNLFIGKESKREALRKERLITSFNEEIVYLTIASLEEEIGDVTKTADSITVSVKASHPYLAEGLEKLYRFLDLEEIPDSVEIGDPVVNLDDYQNPTSSLVIKVDCDLDDIDTTYGEFVEFLKDRSTTHFAKLFKEIEDKEAALL